MTLDIMKSILVLGMIAAHVFQLCYVGGNRYIALFSLYINIITFSSFMFCFGCTSYLAYFKNSRSETNCRLKRIFFRLLVSFYISGFAYLLFVNNSNNGLEYVKVIMLWRIPGYSEFLISFALLNVVLLLCKRKIAELLNGSKKVWGGGILSVAAFNSSPLLNNQYSTVRHFYWNYKICLLPNSTILSFIPNWDVLSIKKYVL